jgi:hypothetical protein
MVEGSENDSFDTSIVQDPYEDDIFLSSGPSQLSSSSQGLSLGSQDSIRDFANNADEDQVILKAPFHPSLASTRHASSEDKERTPVPEFVMPTVEVSSPRRSNQSSRTIRPTLGEQQEMRRRGLRRGTSEGSPQRRQYATRESLRRYDSESSPARRTYAPGSWERVFTALSVVFSDTASWSYSVFSTAMRFATWPLGIIFAVYLVIGAAMLAKTLITESISASLSPLCRLPGASLLELPFCPTFQPVPNSDGTQHVEFDELMNVQAQFEKVLEDSAQGVSLPMEMKRSEASVRNLRTMVKFSDLSARDELVLEFDGYVEVVRDTSSRLQKFGTNVGSAVDSVISINRWTSRYIDSIAVSREADNNVVARWSGWLFTPFQPIVFDERMLLDKYIEHTALVSERIEGLILEAHATLRLLSQAENHLQQINEHVVRNGNAVKDQQNEVLGTLWGLLGGNNQHLKKLRAQLSLLKQVEVQRTSAVHQLMGLVHDLSDIQNKLSDLRDRVAAPELLADRSRDVPLTVHIEIINAGVERLEAARSRIRAEENDRLQEALARVRSDDRLIEG